MILLGKVVGEVVDEWLQYRREVIAEELPGDGKTLVFGNDFSGQLGLCRRGKTPGLLRKNRLVSKFSGAEPSGEAVTGREWPTGGRVPARGVQSGSVPGAAGGGMARAMGAAFAGRLGPGWGRSSGASGALGAGNSAGHRGGCMSGFRGGGKT